MSIGERIKEIRGSTSVSEFCSLFNIHRNTLPRYEAGGTTPDGEFLSSLCERYNIDANWLLLGIGPKFRGDQASSEKAQDPAYFDYIPMVEAKLSAGGGAFVESEAVQNYYAFRKDWLRRVSDSARTLVLMRVIGDSMSPTIQERDTVMVDTARREVSEGKIYAIRYDHTIMIKRLVFRPGDKILVISDNKPEYDPYEVSTKDLHIIGQVIFFSRVLIPE